METIAKTQPKLPVREESGVRRRAELEMDPLALIESEEPTLILDNDLLAEMKAEKAARASEPPPPPPEAKLRRRVPSERVDLEGLVASISKTALPRQSVGNENGHDSGAWEIPSVGGVPTLTAPVMQKAPGREIRLGRLHLTWG